MLNVEEYLLELCFSNGQKWYKNVKNKLILIFLKKKMYIAKPQYKYIHCVSGLVSLRSQRFGFAKGNTLTDTWKGVFRPFHHFIYTHVCLFTLAPIKISKIIKIFSLFYTQNYTKMLLA